MVTKFNNQACVIFDFYLLYSEVGKSNCTFSFLDEMVMKHDPLGTMFRFLQLSIKLYNNV